MKKKPPSDAHRRHLSKDDEATWDDVAATLEPLRRGKSRVPAKAGEAGAPPVRPADGAAKRPAPPPRHPSAAVAGVRVKTPPALSEFDRKAARKLARGHAGIEARIDLHGMRQSEAHGALRRFLFSAHARGLRLVLVITGKGGPRRPRDDDGGHEASYMGAEIRGALKRNVPMWLAEPELRAIVVSYTAAAIQHGGEGALYVHLRRPERVK